MKITKNMKSKGSSNMPVKVTKLPPEKRVKSSIMMPPHKLSGPGYILIRSKGSTRWERLKNLVLFAWRYVWHGSARL